jgi:hypothetical protein
MENLKQLGKRRQVATASEVDDASGGTRLATWSAGNAVCPETGRKVAIDMMAGPISPRFPAAGRPSEPSPAAATDEATTDAGRALIRLEPVTPCERASFRTRRPNAAFLAQLIATQRHAAQTRHRRRAEPAVAVSAYATCAGVILRGKTAFARST